jgi:hypothetical protein
MVDGGGRGRTVGVAAHEADPGSFTVEDHQYCEIASSGEMLVGSLI